MYTTTFEQIVKRPLKEVWDITTNPLFAFKVYPELLVIELKSGSWEGIGIYEHTLLQNNKEVRMVEKNLEISKYEFIKSSLQSNLVSITSTANYISLGDSTKVTYEFKIQLHSYMRLLPFKQKIFRTSFEKKLLETNKLLESTHLKNTKIMKKKYTNPNPVKNSYIYYKDPKFIVFLILLFLISTMIGRYITQ
jgi:hypothetical protein